MRVWRDGGAAIVAAQALSVHSRSQAVYGWRVRQHALIHLMLVDGLEANLNYGGATLTRAKVRVLCACACSGDMA